jgi:hypothetical protein
MVGSSKVEWPKVDRWPSMLLKARLAPAVTTAVASRGSSSRTFGNEGGALGAGNGRVRSFVSRPINALHG